jgi:hypothetical protein
MNNTPNNLAACRECRKPVSPNARACPQCGAPYPAKQKWNGWGWEWKSTAVYYGWPLVHISVGLDKNNRLRMAKGWIAIGQFAVGLITIAQFGVGILFGLGQIIFGFTAVAQVAIALLFGMGQLATGYVAIGQVVLGYYGFAQAGLAQHLWTRHHQDPEAVRFFMELKRYLQSILG